VTPRLAAICLLAAPLASQAPQVVATYTWNGRQGAVTTDDVALEMAPRHRRTAHGKETIDHLVDLHLVRSAAAKAGVLPTEAEVKKQVDSYRQAIAAQGRDPDQYLTSKGVSADELEDYTVLTLALDRLVMRQLDLKDASRVTNEYRELWLKDARKAAGVLTDETALRAGTVARVGAHDITMLDLGRVLSARAKPAERQRYARQVVLKRVLDAEAEAHGIAVTKADCEDAVARIRRRAEAERGGVRFDAMLEALGTNAEELSDSSVLRAQVIARQLLAARHPESELRERLTNEWDDIEGRYGARRRLEVLWLRASATPNQLVTRTFEAAEQEATSLREKLTAGTTFAMLARVHSDDPRTKLAGGDAGWHHRIGESLPAEVLAWAFSAGQGDVSGPVRVRDGVCLVRVAELEAAPPASLVWSRMLDDLEEAFHRELLEKAKIELREGT